MKISIELPTKPKQIEQHVEVIWHKKRIAVVAAIALFFIGVSIWYAFKKETSPFHPHEHAAEVANAKNKQSEFAKFQELPDSKSNEHNDSIKPVKPNADSAEKLTLATSTNSSSEKNEPAKPNSIDSVAKAPLSTPVKINSTKIGQQFIKRGMFTTAIVDKEPSEPLTASLRLGDAPIKRLFYFTEFENYRNHHVVHEWFYEDKLKARVRIGVIGNKYRSYSSKYMTPSMTGTWKVVVREVNGPVLQTAQIDFIE